MKMNELVRGFITKRTLLSDMELNAPLHEAIYRLEATDKLARELLESNKALLEDLVYWPSLHDMYERSYEYCCGVLGCFLIAQFQSSEALCRTAIEGAVNLHYTSLGDSLSKQIAYFKNHLETERKQNINWKNSVASSSHSEELKQYHFEKIDQKNIALNNYEDMLRESLSLVQVGFDDINEKWPSIFDRFRAINDEIGYRTIYAALCSQAHNDAEDALNKIYARVCASVDGLDEAHFIEQYNFSLYMALMAIKYHIFASAMYIAKLEISAEPLIEHYKKVMDAITLVTENGPRLVREKITVR
ncbi:DUF5677 domain-containing protein [Pseudomonas sp. KB-10]|uniref:DUF5677 domain-containing protein n=1 Tax=Pseudomonas sp. KB-10 TaxID=2292264 RepID=UPI001BB088AC|nr:DUF5677 domain-containing protein [Pseudomonas sp. KB-10]